MLLCDLTAPVRRLALVGLAKNTGKTETLSVLLAELQERGRRVGVTSIGRDGEERDVIDSRIEKPRVHLAADSLVATTDGLLRASGLGHELLSRTGIRTPLGQVLIARLQQGGAIEVAGPSGAADVRAVSDAMLEHGAEQVLIDGAVDRRAASSPAVADGLIMASGAVLGADIAEVVEQTVDAVDLVRLAEVSRTPALAAAERAAGAGVLVAEAAEPVALPPRFALSADAEQIGQLLDASPGARWLLIEGALPESFLSALLHSLRARGRELVVVVRDSTRVFLSGRGPGWYRRQGLRIEVREQTALKALTVNPVAPRSHRFDSAQLRGLLAAAIADVPILDVRDPAYRAQRPAAGG